MTYEVRFSSASLAPADLRDGTILGFSFLVNDDDGAVTADGTGRAGWIEFTPGIGTGKRPYLFGELVLSASGVVPDAGSADDGGALADAGAGAADSGDVVDGGAEALDASARPPRTAVSSCACHASGGHGGALPAAGVAVLLLGVVMRRRRAPRSTRP